MGFKKQSHKSEGHMFDTDTHCHHRYHELLKEARIWNSMGQYWLGKEAELLAEQLLNGNKSSATMVVKSEQHFQKTRRML